MNTKGRNESRPLRKPSELQVRGAVALLLLLSPAAWAGGVVTNCTEADLRAAMAGGGVVTFACDGTILLANTITNLSDTRLEGSGHQVTISGNQAVRVFYVTTNVSLTVVNITIANGTSLGGSAILNLGGAVSLTGVTFRSNTATLWVGDDDLSPKASGGAIFNRGGTVNATNCSFAGNTAQTPTRIDPWLAQVCGGAIRNEAGRVDLHSCAFVGNRASGGDAVWPALDPGIGDPGFGGALHNSGTVTLDLCTLAGNSATGGAGGQPRQGSGVAAFPGSEGSGGAIFNQGTMVADRSVFGGNIAGGGRGGGGASGYASPWILDGSAGGSGGGANGAAICNSGSLWVTRSTFATNVATGGDGGGGGLAYPGGSADGGNGGNGNSGLGGALFNSGAASLVNCTLAFNTGRGGAGGAGGGGAGPDYGGSGGAGGNGGSGFGGVDGSCNLTNCTVAWNVGQAGVGGAGGEGAWGKYGSGTNGPPGTNGAAWGGTVCSPMVNTLIASNTPAGNDTFADPKLGPLADNGGTTLTMALLPGSPAIDAGNTSLAPTTDQRGFPRPAALAADIGAFEYGSLMPALTISTSDVNGLSILGNGNAGQPCRLLSSMDLFELGSDCH